MELEIDRMPLEIEAARVTKLIDALRVYEELLARPLWLWMQQHNANVQCLVRALACDLHQLERLAMVRCPPRGKLWEADVSLIAICYGSDPTALTSIIRAASRFGTTSPQAFAASGKR